MNSDYLEKRHNLESSYPLPTNESVGSFKDKKVAMGNKILFVALMIIGLTSMGVIGGMGFANLGNHLNWWPVAGFSHLSQIGAIAMVASGGGAGLLLIIGGLIGLAKTRSSKGDPPTPKPTTTSEPEPKTTDNEVLTAPTLDLTISVEDLKTRLTDSTFTFVLQTNNDYALVEKIPHVSGDELKLSGNIPPYELVTQAIYCMCQGLTFVLTSSLPPDVAREIEDLQQPVIHPGFDYKKFTSSDSD